MRGSSPHSSMLALQILTLLLVMAHVRVFLDGFSVSSIDNCTD